MSYVELGEVSSDVWRSQGCWQFDVKNMSKHRDGKDIRSNLFPGASQQEGRKLGRDELVGDVVCD